ncbi:meiosis inhibitor protein 1 [Austrofundulus limnaeus]|uniref:Meiosis inhibitor protein 1 n=1 Tax=Austrofundulus limnaeus TaxID=52670 RepID=A0A2I4BKW2_AUSLI|nr:PREDICTED: meiosis inhibitor protein 1 [Austrofundulus limnaeus]
MSSADIIYEKVHFGHDPKWSIRLRPEEGGGLFCLACVVEIIQADEIAYVRKSFALSGVSGMLKRSAGALKELLRQDHRVTLHFIITLIGMLQTVEDLFTVEKVDQVLVQLLLEFQNELPLHFVLDEIHKQLGDMFNVTRFRSMFIFLGNLLKTVPNVAHSLMTQYVPLLDHLCSAWLYPDEALKTSLVFIWLQLLGTSGDAAAQSLPVVIRDRVCRLLLQTLQTFASAGSGQLIKNCAGLLWQLVRLDGAVPVLMNSSGSQVICDENQDSLANNSQILVQNQEQQPADHCLLPLLLKTLLLSGDETLQVTSAKCIAAILVHSPSQYCSVFIKADLPVFLFDRLACCSSEMLLRFIYFCLLLLTEDPLLFSQCHTVYGIESLVRSLKEASNLTNLDVPKQGFLLLTEILERQPPSVHLFPSGSAFGAVSEVLLAGVSSSCLSVATQAISATTALFGLNHQPSPVQYKEIIGLIETITSKFPELLLPSSTHRRNTGSLRRSDPNSQTFRSQEYLLKVLVCFQAACRLAEECASEPFLMKNPFTSPYKHKCTDSLESLCQCLLRCCDSVWIPTVLRFC